MIKRIAEVVPSEGLVEKFGICVAVPTVANLHGRLTYCNRLDLCMNKSAAELTVQQTQKSMRYFRLHLKHIKFYVRCNALNIKRS